MAVERATKRIRPQDYELSQVQDNVANALDSVLTSVAKGSFRRTLQMGTFWVGNGPMPTIPTTFVRTVSQLATSTTQTMTASEVMPNLGSVLSLQALANGPVSDKWTVTLYKNFIRTVVTVTTATQKAVVSIPQGRLPFIPGDVFTVYIQGNSAGINQSFSASIDVESQA